ncbi:hypothetical protein RJ639_000826 [Escallonia herrerae]|uniref:Retrotransposon protein, putative, Ty1-copia subclass n=1 Tax=Escallonia herrerae TaxID=1293975 RepID=A0AA88XAA0_9ASTE|nr:hypothetical protein RJ639_000826 [Escallonia herrerae]
MKLKLVGSTLIRALAKKCKYFSTSLHVGVAKENPHSAAINKMAALNRVTAIFAHHQLVLTFLHCIILSALSDRLYDVYHATKSAKELWNLLQGEYGIDDAGIERFNASTFNKFVMVEGKAISDQIHEFQDHLRAVEENGSKFSEDYKKSSISISKVKRLETNAYSVIMHEGQMIPIGVQERVADIRPA